MKNEYLTVSKFAALCGVTPRALKYYEEAGLLTPEKTAPNGYRLYDRGQLDEVSTILLFKEHGFSLAEIREMVSRQELAATRDRLALQLSLIERRQAVLQQQEAFVRDTLAHLEKALAHTDMPFSERHAAQRIVRAPFPNGKAPEEFMQNYLLNGRHSGVYFDFASFTLRGTYRTLPPGESDAAEETLSGESVCLYHRSATPGSDSAPLENLRAEAARRSTDASEIFCEAVLESAKPENCLFRYFFFCPP